MNGYGVRAWPDKRDPRNAAFACMGYDGKAFPPWSWRLFALDAGPGYEALLDGVQCDCASFDIWLAEWSGTSPEPPTLTCSIFQIGENSPQPGQPSIYMTARLTRPDGRLSEATLNAIFPHALREWHFVGFRFTDDGSLDPGLPTGVYIVPTRFAN